MLSERQGTVFRQLGMLMLAAAFLQSAGCGSIRRAAINTATGAFAGGTAAEVYSSDEDPQLVADAMPFALKTYEVLIAGDPTNREFYRSAAAGFVQYSAAFVESEADFMEEEDYEKAREMRKRAARLYLRGSRHALGGLEVTYPGFQTLLREDAEAALAQTVDWDVPLLFWAGAGWMGAISNNPSNMSGMAEMGYAEAIMRRVLELDADWDDGAVHEFFISLEGSRSEAMGGSPARAREHYRLAVELSGGLKAAPHVALAETVAVREQNLQEFENLLAEALAVDLEGEKRWRLSNILAQKKARFLRERAADLFVEYDEGQN
jgi:predicted anti-sigma-YlaC factor YlaD